MTTAAIGERQMLPLQTKHSRYVGPAGDGRSARWLIRTSSRIGRGLSSAP